MRSSSSSKVSSKKSESSTTLWKSRHYLPSLKYLPPSPNYSVENASAVPKLPLWGRNNNPEEWLDANDFEIISVAYRHEVEIFLKTVAPYFPRGSTTEKITPPKPHMPLSLSDFPTSVNNFPTSRITKTLRDGKINANKTLPITSVASLR